MAPVFKLFAFVFACCTVGHFIKGDTLGSTLTNLLKDEEHLRQNLENKVSLLKTRAALLRRTIDRTCNCSATQSRPVSFTATFPGNYKSGLTVSTQFIFTGDVSNVGQRYNVSNGRFTAPVSGLYGFSLTVMMAPGYWVGMELVKQGHSITKLRTGHRSYYRNMATNFVMVNMTTGQQVWVEYLGDSDSKYLYGEGVTTFTGYLLHQY